MQVPSIPAHQKLAQDAAQRSQVLNAERKNPSDENEASMISAAVMCAGLSIAAALERTGIGLMSVKQ